MTIQAGAIITAADIVAETQVVTDTSPGVVAGDFTVNNAVVRTTHGGKDVYVCLMLARTGTAITVSTTAPIGNIADTTCYTLDAEYRPIEAVQAIFGNGTAAGQATINPNGTVVIRTSNATISTNDTVNITARYLRA